MWMHCGNFRLVGKRMKHPRLRTAAGLVASCLLRPLVLAGISATSARAQPPAIIDSIAIEMFDVFTPHEARRNLLGRLGNAAHFRTRAWVVRNELLFHVGEPLRMERLQETERNLRRLRLFSRVAIDTVHDDDRLVVLVVTQDGWTTNGDLGFSSTANVVTWHAGLIERNLLGTGNAAGFFFRHEPDRSALRFVAQVNRPFGSRVLISGYYDHLSDGRVGVWAVEVPFGSLSERFGVDLSGEAAGRRVLRFRDGAQSDSLWRRMWIERVSLGWAPIAGPAGYVRLGIFGQVRRDQHIVVADTARVIPDSVTAAAGPYVEMLRARYVVVTHFNGFAREEDIDVGTRLILNIAAAPAAWGYDRDGVGAALGLQIGSGHSEAFARLRIGVSGLFTSVGLDSGQVRAGLTLASRMMPRQATILYLQAGVQKNQAPGSEFDLGHGVGPRGFGPHAFTGTRMLWAIVEHRVFLWDALFDVLGVGVAGFLDYGGAWYRDQPLRLGGDAGIGLRLGLGARSTGTNVVRFDLACRFGEGAAGSRVVLSIGRAFEF